MSKPPSAPPYHHGDLRRALLDGAHAILVETGRWDFSLREVARRAGVSHNAPYRHFADKEALLAAIGVGGFDLLRQGGLAAAAGTTTAAETLAALGKAYIRFGLANPALYRLMFGQALPAVDAIPTTLLEAIAVARGALRDVILMGARDGSFAVDADNAAEVTTASVGAWSLVHGLTMLTIDRIVERDTDGEIVADLSDRVVDSFVLGLRSGRTT